ncbi:tetratricopeptide repeat protein [Dactylosporangium sucinum]|uniref:Tetratricopeptide repeat protein n=1 Tax=Dactylosporangium sucinum TaxID=1424081 RepID=A0A917U0S3_9ACTN|nr:tetratricopeptide repeat protein [Dactylosporangium sucinum]GGM46718.1 hypothetical protein GCM10007977_055530 [Dactylosporangium sucinum]
MTGFGPAEELPRVSQQVTAAGGFAYGVVGADIHVFGDGMPLYVLENWRPAAEPDPEWLRELPSRMLNARFEVVGFTGRTAELAGLHAWCGTGPRLAARWLHGPGGVGKSRLAAQFAAEAAGLGWKVVTATHGPGAVLPPPGSQDLTLDGAAGLLMIVDYADRWPHTHLTWLFSNAVLHRPGVTTRVLLLARTADAWPSVRAALANHQAGTSGQALEPLPGEGDGRATMFGAARDSFGARYGIPHPSEVERPALLDQPGLGLTLALHMAALVAVDAHVSGRRVPADPAGLSVYLLDREHRHWADRYGDPSHNLEPGPVPHSPPDVMSRTVFVAALSGPVPEPAGLALMRHAHAGPAPAQVLADHALCYPPAGPGLVLSPLYPDRLAEDFLALTLPGHRADYPAQPWAGPTTTGLLASRDVAARAVTFLAAATARWPHVGPAVLYPALEADPQLALDAGSAALSALAAIDDVDPELLARIEARFPDRAHLELDPGIAAVAERLTLHRLAGTGEPADRAELHQALAVRQSRAGLDEQALSNAEQAVALFRTVTGGSAEPDLRLARALYDLGFLLSSGERNTEAVAATREAAGLFRAAVRHHRGENFEYARALTSLGTLLRFVGRFQESVAAARLAVAIHRRVAAAAPHVASARVELAVALGVLSSALAALGQRGDAAVAAQEAHRLREAAAANDPGASGTDRAAGLLNLARRLSDEGRAAEALHATEEALDVYQRAAALNPAGYGLTLVQALGDLSRRLAAAGRSSEAIDRSLEALALVRRLARTVATVSEAHVVRGLSRHAELLCELSRWDEAIEVLLEAADLQRTLPEAQRGFGMLYRLSVLLAADGRGAEAMAANEEALRLGRAQAAAEPEANLDNLASVLNGYAVRLFEAGRPQEAIEAGAESIRIRRRRLDEHPGLNEHELVTSLGNQGVWLSRLDRHDAALDALTEAVTVGRRLAAAEPRRYRAELARAAHNRGDCLGRLGRWEEALAGFQEALAVHRELAAEQWAVHAPALAKSCTAVATALTALDRPGEALPYHEEAATVFGRLAEDDPAGYAEERAAAVARLTQEARPAAAEPPADGPAAWYAEAARLMPRLISEPGEQVADRVIDLLERASSAPGVPAADRARSLGVLGIACRVRYGRTGAVADLDRSLDALRRAIGRYADDQRQRDLLAGSLVATVKGRAGHPMTDAELVALIGCLRETAARVSAGEPQRTSLLAWLRTLLTRRFADLQEPADLDEAIDAGRAVLAGPPPEDLDRAYQVRVLDELLRTRLLLAGSAAERGPASMTRDELFEAVQARAVAVTGDGPEPDPSAALGPDALAEVVELARRVEADLARRPVNGADLLAAFMIGVVRFVRHSVLAGDDATDLAAAQRWFGLVLQVAPAIVPEGLLGMVAEIAPPAGDDPPAWAAEAARLLDLPQADEVPQLLDRAIRLYEQAAAASPDHDAALPGWLDHLGRARFRRYQRTRDVTDLDREVEALRRAIAATAHGTADRSARLNRLAGAITLRARLLDRPADAREAVDLARRAVEMVPAGDPRHARYLNTLGGAWLYRFEATYELSDVDAALDALQGAAGGLPDGDPLWAGRQRQLAEAWLARASVTAAVPDIDRAIEVFERIAAAKANDSRSLADLAHAWSKRYAHSHRPADRERIVEIGQRALDAAADEPANDGGAARTLGSISTALRIRQNAADLDAAVDLRQRIVAAMPSGSAQRARYLALLAQALRERFERGGDPADRDEWETVAGDLVAATPEDDPARAGRLAGLSEARAARLAPASDAGPGGPADSVRTDDPEELARLSRRLCLRGRQEGDRADLDEAVRLAEQALDRTPADRGTRAERWFDLGNARLARRGELADLDRAVDAHGEAVLASAEILPQYARYAEALVTALLERYEWTFEPADLDRALAAAGRAVASGGARPADRARCLCHLSAVLRLRFERTGDHRELDQAVEHGRRAVAALEGHPAAEAVLAAALEEQRRWAPIPDQALGNLAADTARQRR